MQLKYTGALRGGHGHVNAGLHGQNSEHHIVLLEFSHGDVREQFKTSVGGVQELAFCGKHRQPLNVSTTLVRVWRFNSKQYIVRLGRFDGVLQRNFEVTGSRHEGIFCALCEVILDADI